jgi:hypothetical protein
MNREEAIDIFEHNWTRLQNADYTEKECNQAIAVAIRSLEAWDKVIEDIEKAMSPNDYSINGMYVLNGIINKHLGEVEK